MNHPRHRENPWTLTKKNPRSIVSAPFYPNLPGKNPAEHRPLPSRRGPISPTCWTFLLKIQIRKKFEALAPAGGPDFHQNPMQQPRPLPFKRRPLFPIHAGILPPPAPIFPSTNHWLLFGFDISHPFTA
jgi:hypothetical protein